jgi:fructose-specific phosphotransferase system IIA component
MSISEFMSEDRIAVDLQAEDKTAAITEMMEILARSELVADKDQALHAILEREKTMSTGIGHGVAIPHGKSNGVKGLVAALGISKKGIPFESIDQQPVHILVLMAAPMGPAGPHIKALSRISRVLNLEEAREKLRTIDNAADALNVFLDAEKDLPNP